MQSNAWGGWEGGRRGGGGEKTRTQSSPGDTPCVD